MHDLSLAQSIPCHRRHRLDGGDALSAAAVRLSLRRRARLEAIRNLQGDGAPAAASDHQSGDDRDLATRPVARLATADFSAPAGCTPSSHWCSCSRPCTDSCPATVKDFAADRNRRSQKFYRIINEVPAVLMVRDRDPGDRETVLTTHRHGRAFSRASCEIAFCSVCLAHPTQRRRMPSQSRASVYSGRASIGPGLQSRNAQDLTSTI